MNLITKLPPRAYMQRVRRNRNIYCDVNAPKCTSDSRLVRSINWMWDNLRQK